MSTIGKIFIILNALLAAAFLGYAVHSLGKSKEVVEAHKKVLAERDTKLAEQDKQIADLAAKLNSETGAKDQARAEAANNKDLAERNQRDLDASKDDASKLKAQLDKISESLNGFNTTNDDLNKAKDKAVSAQRDAEKARDQALSEKADAEKARRDAEDTLANANVEIEDLKTQVATAQKSIDDLNTKLSTVVAVTGVDVSAITAQPQVDGAVLGVSYDVKPGLVTLNVGSDKGVTAGMTFDVYRGEKYKGRVRVQKVLNNMCSALIVNAVAGQTIGQGDNATTRL
jgi:predicted  nucleic acid-binding Zn-ribbon protein